MISYLLMVNAWSLVASILNKTFDKDYPIMDKTKGRWNEEKISPLESDEYDIPHSDAYYEYKRNDPDAENPFTDPVDRAKADFVEKSYDDYYGLNDDDGLDYESDYMSDIDDQYWHHFGNGTVTLYGGSEPYAVFDKNFDRKVKKQMEMTDHRYKYHESEILKDIEEYVSSTYNGHYTGSKHEFRKVQTIDLMAARDLASHFCQANILKYGSRYGSKDGKNKKDLMKVIHYAMLLAHFDGHYGEPSMPSDDFEQMP